MIMLEGNKRRSKAANYLEEEGVYVDDFHIQKLSYTLRQNPDKKDKIQNK